MVDVEIAGHGDSLTSVRINPATRVHNASAGIAEEDSSQALLNQHFRACILTITVRINPQPPVVTVVRRQSGWYGCNRER